MSRKKQILFVMLFSAVVLGICGALTYVKYEGQFRLKTAMNQPAYWVGEEGIKLKDIMYYIMIEEDDVNDTAEHYDQDNPSAYWNLYMNHHFLSKIGAHAAINFAIRDDLYVREAKKQGIHLSKEEEAEILDRAKGVYEDLSPRQRKTTKLTEKSLQKILTQRSLSNSYCLWMGEKEGVSLTGEALDEKYGIKSSYFKDLKKKYQVRVNKKTWDHLTLGHITIN